MADITSPAEIPKDWHQKWLQVYLTGIEEAIERLEHVAMDSEEYQFELSPEDRKRDVDGALQRAFEAVQNCLDVLEDTHNYLNVDPRHVGS
jgi:hypothetical protein